MVMDFDLTVEQVKANKAKRQVRGHRDSAGVGWGGLAKACIKKMGVGVGRKELMRRFTKIQQDLETAREEGGYQGNADSRCFKSELLG